MADARNPCLKCDNRNFDKNTNTCAKCVLRINYVKSMDYFTDPNPTSTQNIYKKTTNTIEETSQDDIILKKLKAGKKKIDDKNNIVETTNIEHKEKGKDECLLCDRKAERRGLCMRCYGRWRKGLSVHPIIGKFQVMSLDELADSRSENIGKCLIDGCEKTGNRRGLCHKHYTRWRRDQISHPVEGYFIRKYEKLNGNTAKYNPLLISINFEKYPKLFEKLKEVEEIKYLPMEIVIVSILSEGLKK